MWAGETAIAVLNFATNMVPGSHTAAEDISSALDLNTSCKETKGEHHADSEWRSDDVFDCYLTN